MLQLTTYDYYLQVHARVYDGDAAAEDAEQPEELPPRSHPKVERQPGDAEEARDLHGAYHLLLSRTADWLTVWLLAVVRFDFLTVERWQLTAKCCPR